jgi:hypothetical protein
MKDKDFFYRLNNYLILIMLIFVGFLVYSKLSVAHSQSTPTPTPTNPGQDVSPTLPAAIPAYTINREINVNIDPSKFTVHWVSDGLSGGALPGQKAKFLKGAGGADASLSLIETPVNFNFNKEDSKLLLPGELVYPVIRKGTAPTSYQCVEKGKAQNNAENERNCLFNVTLLSVYADMQTQSVVLGDQQYKVSESNVDYFTNLVDTLRTVLENITNKNVIAANTGLPDQSRQSIGTVRYWGDDSYQQYVPISGGKQSRASTLTTKGSTEGTGNNVDEGLFATEFSPGLDVKFTTKYKQANITNVVLCNNNTNPSTPSNPLASLLSFFETTPVCGPGQIYDPFTSGNVQPTGLASTLRAVADSFLMVVNQNNPSFSQKQQRLGAQVAIRPRKESTDFSLKYNICDAFSANPSKYKLTEHKNIYANSQNQCVAFTQDPITGLTTVNPNYSNCTEYQALSSNLKKCYSGIAQYTDATKAEACIKSEVEKGIACDEVTVEEQGLSLSMMEKAFPIGLGAYFQNSTLKYLDPVGHRGPYINYLSNSYCGKLNLAFKLTPGGSYIYDIAAEDGKSGRAKEGGKFKETNLVNEYCVVGGLLSNFSYALLQMTSNNYSTDTFDGKINVEREKLTCDKKEMAYFGADPIKTNTDYPNFKPVYITDDNTREGTLTRDEVVIYHGYDAYPLTEILNDPLLKGKHLVKNGLLDMQAIIDPATNKPKYVVLTVMLKEGDAESREMGMFACKFPSERSSYGAIKEKSLCKLIEQGNFEFPSAVGMATNNIQTGANSTQPIDTLTIVYRGAIPGQQGKAFWPFVYKYFDVTEDGDINRGFLSERFTFASEFKTNLDAVQLPSGALAIAGVQIQENKLQTIDAYILDPFEGPSALFERGVATGTITNVARRANARKLTGNLCDINEYCKVMNSLQKVVNVKIAYSAKNGGLYVAQVAGGFGVIYPIDIASTERNLGALTFGYKKESGIFSENFDEISSFKVNADGNFDMFLGRSGYYLNVVFPSTVNNSEIQSKVLNSCGTNCLLTVQKEFNPELFTTDCTDYLGKGICGEEPLNKLGLPQVHEFVYGPTGNIMAWYTHKDLDKTLLESADMLYAYSGVYSKIAGGAEDKEYSNVYIPVSGKISVKEGEKKKEINGPVPTPIRYFNFGNNGLLLDRELKKVVTTITESLGTGTQNSFSGYESTKITDKLDCLERYNTLVTGQSLYYSRTGLTSVNQNTTVAASTNTGGSSNGGSGKSNVNPGMYCEETWCIGNEAGVEIPIVNNPMFRNDGTSNSDAVALRQRIADYVGRPRSFVDKICAQTSAAGIPCALIAATWRAESSASTTEPTPRPGASAVPSLSELNMNGGGGPAMGCMLYSTSYCKSPAGQADMYCRQWYTFENQIKCAVNSLSNRNNEYKEGAVMNGPSDRSDGYDTTPGTVNPNRGEGACVPATRFSYIMQSYTPLDKRINNDNQCNKGIVIRADQAQYCAAGTISYNNKQQPATWGNIVESRPNLKKSLQAMDPRLNITDKCFPNPNASQNGGSGTNNGDINSVLSRYDQVGEAGEMKIDLKQWGTDDAAGNIYMILNYDWQGKSGVNNKGIQGAYVVKAGQEWSFNDQIKNATGSTIQKDVEPLISQTKAPWNAKNFDYDAANRCRDAQGNVNIGCGWCEMATTIRLAAERVKGADGKILTQNKFSGAAAVGSSETYGTESGWKDDINHWSHSGVTTDVYNKLVPSGVKGLDDVTKYVAIETNASNPSGFNDGDIAIKNPYDASQGIDMVITIEQGTDGIVTVKVIFGKQKSFGNNSANRCEARKVVQLNSVAGGGNLETNSEGKIVKGAAMIEEVAAKYDTARTEIKQKTGKDLLDTISDALRPYSLPAQNVNSINKSWHKTGRAVDLNTGLYDSKICSNLQTCLSGRVAENKDGEKYWRIYENGVDVTAVLESYGFKRIPDQCATTPGDKCTEWWHYEYKDGYTWEQAMLQIVSKDELKTYFTDVNWDSVQCTPDAPKPQ